MPLAVPRLLSLSEAYEDTVELLEQLRSLALDRHIPVGLHFHLLEEVEPAAAMVLTAEIYRCRNLLRRSLVNGTYPQNATAYRQLYKIGFFRLLDIAAEDRPWTKPDPNEPMILPFITDAEVTPERTEYFISKLVKVVHDTMPMDEKSQRYLYGAIIEAMKNAGEHAYVARTPHRAMKRRWWMTAGFDRLRGECSILLFDQGVGIPATLQPDLIEMIESMVKIQGLVPTDSLMIEMAARTGRTSTDQAGRGMGFATMRKFVDACDDGHLLVHSNKGHYAYNRQGSTRADRMRSLGGTLIQLRVRHSSSLVSVAT